MREQYAFIIGVIACIALMSGCSGGGASSALPTTNAVTVGVALPVTSGIVAATGPLTSMSGGSIIGSTILPTSAVAVLTLDSGSTPNQITSGGTLSTSTIRISDITGESPASVARSARAVRSVPAPHRQRDPDARIPDRPGAEFMRAQLRELQAHANSVSRAVSTIGRGLSFAPGDHRTFELQGGTITGAQADPTPIPMPATLVAQSAHANVWLDDSVAADSARLTAEYPGGKADFATVAERFESTFAIETRAFGAAYTTGIVNFQECAADGTPLADEPARPDTTGATDPHLNIVITDQLKNSGEGGYFYGLDMLNQFEANCVSGARKPTVNGLPMLVIEGDNYPAYSGDAADTYPATDEAYWLTGDMPQTLAHEFQHYLHFVNKYLEEHVQNPANPTAGTLDDSYIDEGCSVLAEDLVAGSVLSSRESPVFVRAFLLEPSDFSLTAFAGYQPDALASGANSPYGFYRFTAGNYGFAYLFVRYLYDRFGPGALKAIYAETNFNSAVEPDTGPATAAAGGEPFDQLFREFTTAVAIHSGGAVPELSTNPADRFDSSVILRGPVQTYSRRLPPYNVRNIVQPGPLNPEIFTNGVPTGFVSLAAGQTVNVSLLAGGAVFITPLAPWTQGATLSASGSLAGGGSLGQGPLPMPTPADY